MILFLLVLLAFLFLGVYITDPFSRLSIIQQPFLIDTAETQFRAVNENHKLMLQQAPWWRAFAYIKRFLHILRSRYVHSPGSRAATITGIIADIHAYRFRPDRLLLTSGDHFGDLFVRNLGVFFYPMLDLRIQSTAEDWRNRQIVYMQTLAYALGVFKLRPIPVTTIVPTGAYAATCINLYAYPSDTVYALLYALAALLGYEAATPAPTMSKAQHALDTQGIAQQLLDEYRETLKKLYAHYTTMVYDQKIGLIRTDKHFSGAKDITRRSSSFYDNVIFWKTTELAGRLGIIPEDKKFQRDLKVRILKTFWLQDKGYFLEDLSAESIQHAYYSSDWLIVLITGFINPVKANERPYFERSISYIQKKHIDKPFALKYQHETRAHRQFFLVRIAVAAYGGDAIWSFWGMEYIKLLLLLYSATSEQPFLNAADNQIQAYERTMLRDRGFPEVYDPAGRLLETPMYRSIRQTGWVIGFEQVRTMRNSIVKKRTS